MKLNYTTKLFLIMTGAICTLTIIIFVILYKQFDNFTIEHEISSIEKSQNFRIEEIKDVFLTLDNMGRKLSTDETVHNILLHGAETPIDSANNRLYIIRLFDNWYTGSYSNITEAVSMAFIINHEFSIANDLVPFRSENFHNSSLALYSDKYLESSEWYNEIVSNGQASLQRINVKYGNSTICFGFPIYRYSEYQKEFLGILMFNIDFQQLFNNLDSIINITSAQYAICNNDGTFFAFSNNWNNESDDGLLLKEGYAYDNSKKHVIIDYVGYDLSIVSKIAYADVVFPMENINKQYAFVLILTLLLSFVISFLLAHSFSKPIRKLSATMENFEQSITFSEEEFSAYPKDIAVLFNAYNKMTQDINRLINVIKEKTIKEMEMESKLLQAQINPHFLYNALDSIACNMLLEGENKTADSITMLSDICRYSLQNPNNLATIHDELEFIKSYVEFHSWQSEKEIKLVSDIDTIFLDYKIPKYIIQPLVENAIIHNGIINNLIIKLSFYENEKSFIIDVSDNGTGCNVDNLNKYIHGDNTIFSTPKNGIKNVHSRLQLKFGQDSGLSYIKNPNGGTKAIVTINKDMYIKNERFSQ